MCCSQLHMIELGTLTNNALILAFAIPILAAMGTKQEEFSLEVIACTAIRTYRHENGYMYYVSK